MKKQYINPELAVVRLHSNDIVTISYEIKSKNYQEGFTDLAPDRRFESWYEGY